MFKVEYCNRIVPVLDVHKECGYGWYGEEAVYMPTNTWFLISYNEGFLWVKSDDCKFVY